jgi:hypothetical protein
MNTQPTTYQRHTRHDAHRAASAKMTLTIGALTAAASLAGLYGHPAHASSANNPNPNMGIAYCEKRSPVTNSNCTASVNGGKGLQLSPGIQYTLYYGWDGPANAGVTKAGKHKLTYKITNKRTRATVKEFTMDLAEPRSSTRTAASTLGTLAIDGMEVKLTYKGCTPASGQSKCMFSPSRINMYVDVPMY